MKRATPFLFCGLLLVLSFRESSFAQTETSGSHRIGLQFGYLYIQSRDDRASPLKYTGNALPLYLTYEYSGESHRHQVRLSFRSDKLESERQLSGDHSLRETGAGFAYSYLQKTDILGESPMDLFLGGEWNNSIEAREYTYNAQFGGTELLGEFYSSLNITSLLEYRLSNRSFVSARLSLPIVTFAVRPGYSSSSPAPEEGDSFGTIIRGGKFSSWESFRAIAVSVNYMSVISDHFDYGLYLSLDYSQYSKPQPTKSALTQFGFVLYYKL